MGGERERKDESERSICRVVNRILCVSIEFTIVLKRGKETAFNRCQFFNIFFIRHCVAVVQERRDEMRDLS